MRLSVRSEVVVCVVWGLRMGWYWEFINCSKFWVEIHFCTAVSVWQILSDICDYWVLCICKFWLRNEIATPIVLDVGWCLSFPFAMDSISDVVFWRGPKMSGNYYTGLSSDAIVLKRLNFNFTCHVCIACSPYFCPVCVFQKQRFGRVEQRSQFFGLRRLRK